MCVEETERKKKKNLKLLKCHLSSQLRCLASISGRATSCSSCAREKKTSICVRDECGLRSRSAYHQRNPPPGYIFYLSLMHTSANETTWKSPHRPCYTVSARARNSSICSRGAIRGPIKTIARRPGGGGAPVPPLSLHRIILGARQGNRFNPFPWGGKTVNQPRAKLPYVREKADQPC